MPSINGFTNTVVPNIVINGKSQDNVATHLKPWFHVKNKRILVFYFNMEPRMKRNKIILKLFQTRATAVGRQS